MDAVAVISLVLLLRQEVVFTSGSLLGSATDQHVL